MILDFELECTRKVAQAHPGTLGSRVFRDVTERFLQDTIDVNGDVGINWNARSRPLVRHGQTKLPLDVAQVPVERALETELVENRGVQRLR